MSLVVVATISPKPGEESAVREALLTAIPHVHEEPGCELYALHEGDGGFVMIEQWESPEALRTHSKADALARLGAALAGKVTAAPQVRTLTAVPGGDADKGRL